MVPRGYENQFDSNDLNFCREISQCPPLKMHCPLLFVKNEDYSFHVFKQYCNTLASANTRSTHGVFSTTSPKITIKGVSTVITLPISPLFCHCLWSTMSKVTSEYLPSANEVAGSIFTVVRVSVYRGLGDPHP